MVSSDRGGIRIQFSKNPFGKKRDASGNLVDLRNHAVNEMGEFEASSAAVTVTDLINNCTTNGNGSGAGQNGVRCSGSDANGELFSRVRNRGPSGGLLRH